MSITRAGVVLQNNRKEYALVLGRQHNKWSFPKGHLNENESFKDCAVRETKEETGIDIIIPDNAPYFTRGGARYYFVHLNNSPKFDPVDTNEVRVCVWISKENMFKLDYRTLNYGVKSFLR